MAVRYPSFDDLNRKRIRDSIAFNSLKSKLINGPGAGAFPAAFANTPTPSISLTPSITPTYTSTPTVTPTISLTPTNTVTPSITKTITPSVSISPSITPSITETPTNTPTISITPSVTPTISETPTITPTISITPSITPTISVTPSISPTNTLTPSTTRTPQPTPTVTPSTSFTPTPSYTPNFIPSPTPTPYQFYLDGPGQTGVQGVVYNSFITSRFLFNGTGTSPIFPTDMFIYYNGTIVATASFNTQPGNNRLGTPFTWIVNYNDTNSPRFNGVFTNGPVYFTDSFPLSPTPTPSPTMPESPTPTPSPSPEVTPTPTSTFTNNNILFDKSSFVGKVNEPYLTALNAAVDRWSTYLRIPQARVDIIRSIDPTFNGIRINNYTEYNDPSSTTIASCGVYNFYIFNGGVGHQLCTGTFNLNVNLKYASTYSAQDWANVMTHEIGHALGIGQFWQSFFETYGSEPPSNYFLNASAYNALSAAYGTLLGGRPKVALESGGGSGTTSSHWENDFRDSSAAGSLGFNYPGLYNELMCGFYSKTISFKLSPISIKCLTDFGYEEVTPGASEGNPTLVNALIAGIQGVSEGESIIKFEHCKEPKELGSGDVFDKNGDLLYTGVIFS